ncbi:MAG: cyanophycin synthetase [Planctomycetia bacterium]|nr:cyanophycin synthetase [Planctomycetia bacterium]
MQFSLKRLRDFLDYLGYPDRQFAIVHVAGTKGKGSVCNNLDKIWRAAGYRVGLFTSPHINDFLERFQINGKPCDKTFFAETMLGLTERWKSFDAAYRQRYADQFKNAVVTQDDKTIKEQVDSTQTHDQIQASATDNAKESNPSPLCSNDTINPPEFTFFEWSLILALTLFARAGVQIAILEVGMGGSFDATNVCQADVSVITSISYDHCEQLGYTLEAIATEKAGVIKSDAPVVCGVGFSQFLYPDVERVLAQLEEIKQKREDLRQRALQELADLENPDIPPQEKNSQNKTSKKNEHNPELNEQLLPLFDESVFKKEEFALLAHDETLVRPQELARVKQVIRNKALSCNAPFYQIEALQPSVENLPTPPFDSIRKWNLQIALKVVEIMATRDKLPSKYNDFNDSNPNLIKNFPVQPKDIATALLRLDVPARFQVVSTRPLIILDGAHNRASVAAVLRQLREHYPDKKISVLFASTVGKDLPGMLAELFARADEIILTERAKAPRAAPLAEMIQAAEDLLDYYCDENAAIRSVLRVAPDYRAFLTDYCARTNRQNEILCLLGSFYFVADAKEVIDAAKKA